MVAGLLICLAMLRLGVWQLDRAEQKRVMLEQMVSRAAIPPVDLPSLLHRLQQRDYQELQFRQVDTVGQYAPEKSIYIDNKVHASEVGYHLYTPLQLGGSDQWLLVKRGWIQATSSRAVLPVFRTPSGTLRLRGRLIAPPGPPPLWDADYAVADGATWQYLPIGDFAVQMQLKVLPLVLELAPGENTIDEPELIHDQLQIDDQWVSRHQAYAFQWFALAVAFFIACLILVFRSLKDKQHTQTDP